MRNNIAYFFLLSLILIGCRDKSTTSTSHSLTNIPMCRVYFGSGDEHSIVIGRTEDQLLIYRDGDLRSSPETYAMPDKRLDDLSAVSPFQFGGVPFTLKSCNEYKDTDPSPRHALMLFVDIGSDNASFTQYCDVSLSTGAEDFAVARFDGSLMIGPPTNNFELEPIVFDIGGKATDLRSLIGTIDKDDDCWTVVAVHPNGQCHFPDKVRPEVIIEFPTDGGKTIRREVVLTEFC